MRKFIYDSSGVAVSDFETEDFINNFINSSEENLVYSTENVLTMLVLMYLNDKINIKNYEIVISGKVVEIDSCGFIITDQETLSTFSQNERHINSINDIRLKKLFE